MLSKEDKKAAFILLEKHSLEIDKLRNFLLLDDDTQSISGLCNSLYGLIDEMIESFILNGEIPTPNMRHEMLHGFNPDDEVKNG